MKTDLERLTELEAERELLLRELGVCDAESIIALVRSLDAQLCDLYRGCDADLVEEKP
jgi:hypothetical protein